MCLENQGAWIVVYKKQTAKPIRALIHKSVSEVEPVLLLSVYVFYKFYIYIHKKVATGLLSSMIQARANPVFLTKDGVEN